MSSRGAGEFAILSLQSGYVGACSELEARSFNVWRRWWGEPLQSPRRRDWLAYRIQRYPDYGSAALIGNEVIGYAVVHVWGTLGWIGPVAVEPAMQGRGVGSALTRWGLQVLQDQGCQTIALETWPNSPHNIGFYIKLGFNPGPLVAALEKATNDDDAPLTGCRFGDDSQIDTWLAPLSELSRAIMPGLDYGPLARTTVDCQMGEVIIWGPKAHPDAMAVVHTASHHEGAPPSYANVELLLVRPGKEHLLDDLVGELESAAATAGRSSIRISLSTIHSNGLRRLVDRGYRLVKTRLRMYHRYLSVPAECVDYVSYVV
jgi:ribosomal protein S18 acetylase RimI-like enzyme